MGASAFLKSVDFTAFAINAKTIALGKYLYQFGHAIWCERSVGEIIAYLLLGLIPIYGRYIAYFMLYFCTDV